MVNSQSAKYLKVSGEVVCCARYLTFNSQDLIDNSPCWLQDILLIN